MSSLLAKHRAATCPLETHPWIATIFFLDRFFMWAQSIFNALIFFSFKYCFGWIVVIITIWGLTCKEILREKGREGGIEIKKKSRWRNGFYIYGARVRSVNIKTISDIKIARRQRKSKKGSVERGREKQRKKRTK